MEFPRRFGVSGIEILDFRRIMIVETQQGLILWAHGGCSIKVKPPERPAK